MNIYKLQEWHGHSTGEGWLIYNFVLSLMATLLFNTGSTYAFDTVLSPIHLAVISTPIQGTRGQRRLDKHSPCDG